jgi:3-oxoacyl-[acyl-carrier protein] reductase
MADFLLDLARNPRARNLIRSLGLPVPLPTPLARDASPWQARPLAESDVVVAAAPGAELLTVVAATLAAAGANPLLHDPSLAAPFAEAGDAFGRPARAARLDEEATALVYDASALASAADLRGVYDFFHARVEKLTRSGRVVVLGRAGDGATPEQAAARAALDGFVRSLAKELGRRGATANLVLVEAGAEARLPGVLRFLLSRRSAFVTGQPLVVTSQAAGAAEPPWVRPLDKKVVLVTGAARGIGEATARLLAQEGAHVLCVDRPGDEGPLSQLARAIGGTAVAVDVTADDAGARLAEAVQARGGVDVIVHNAGITRDKTLARMTPELWDQAVAVNLEAVVRLTAALEPHLREGGRVICLSSVAGLAGNVGQTNYAASKAGIVGFVRALAPRLAARGVTVNAIAPGFIETRLTAAIPTAIREIGRRLSALGQGGEPQDVGQAIVFLASPGSQGLTGRTLRVCGGAFIGA